MSGWLQQLHNLAEAEGWQLGSVRLALRSWKRNGHEVSVEWVGVGSGTRLSQVKWIKPDGVYSCYGRSPCDYPFESDELHDNLMLTATLHLKNHKTLQPVLEKERVAVSEEPIVLELDAPSMEEFEALKRSFEEFRSQSLQINTSMLAGVQSNNNTLTELLKVLGGLIEKIAKKN